MYSQCENMKLYVLYLYIYTHNYIYVRVYIYTHIHIVYNYILSKGLTYQSYCYIWTYSHTQWIILKVWKQVTTFLELKVRLICEEVSACCVAARRDFSGVTHGSTLLPVISILLFRDFVGDPCAPTPFRECCQRPAWVDGRAARPPHTV